MKTKRKKEPNTKERHELLLLILLYICVTLIYLILLLRLLIQENNTYTPTLSPFTERGPAKLNMSVQVVPRSPLHGQRDSGGVESPSYQKKKSYVAEERTKQIEERVTTTPATTAAASNIQYDFVVLQMQYRTWSSAQE